MTQTIFKAKAKRAGGRITITGEHEDGTPFKVSNVDTIEFAPGPGLVPVATDKNGDTYTLPSA